MDSPFGHTIRKRASRVCAEHGVWFEADMLDAYVVPTERHDDFDVERLRPGP